ncbi:MAG: hypothetical protein ACRBN8_41895 [Nannocystales bacterium]
MIPGTLRALALPALAAAAVAFASSGASAAEPTNTGKRFRFHGELDVLSFSHFNPDGDGENTNRLGFGFGRPTGADRLLVPPVWSLGFGYVFLGGNAIVGGRFAFNLDTEGDEDDGGPGGPVPSRTTAVSGQLVPYFRYLFLPGKRARPFIEGRFGFGGSAGSTRIETDPEQLYSFSEIHPIVGVGGGAHIFLIDAFSIDLALTFDYAAPHTKGRSEVGDVIIEEDYSKDGDFINLAAQAGFSVWF